MSVIIKGKNKPTRCADCFMYQCGATSMDDCPLVEIPPHGRLIDADALKAKQQEDADLFINAVSLAEKSRRDEALNAVANIVNAPTIIPEERRDTWTTAI